MKHNIIQMTTPKKGVCNKITKRVYVQAEKSEKKYVTRDNKIKLNRPTIIIRLVYSL